MAGVMGAGGRGQMPEPEEQATPQTLETVNHPLHYGGDATYEAIKVIEAWGLGFHLGNAVKYIARAGKKSPHSVEDLRKARWYLDCEIARPGITEVA